MKVDRDLLSRAAHELRAPVARMQAAMALLERRLGDREPRYVADVQEEIERLTRVTTDLVTLVEVESGLGPTALSAVSVAEAAARAVQQEGAGAEVCVAVDDDLRVRAHPEYLARSLAAALRVLVEQAGDAGPIVLAAEAAGDSVLVTLADVGPHLPGEALAHVFEPFHRLDPPAGRGVSTGVGLALSRSCIEACGGAVECRNREPIGVEIVLRLVRGAA
jgi:signal transduction histidine kinase